MLFQSSTLVKILWGKEIINARRFFNSDQVLLYDYELLKFNAKYLLGKNSLIRYMKTVENFLDNIKN